ncbi:MAG: OmpA family protein [Rikenellaceae bacterium]|nr:OmpA family protein [Rikenellaceae bacterium]
MKKMNKFGFRQFLLLFVLVAGSLTASAQVRDTKHGMLTNGFWDNWFISAGVGAQVYSGNSDQYGDFGDRITLAYELSFGKWFTPAIGMRVQGGGLTVRGFGYGNSPYQYGDADSKGLYQERFNVVNVHGDFLLNLSAAIGGYKEKRVYELIPYMGLGIVHAFKDEHDRKRNEISATFGLIHKFRLSDAVDFNIEMKHMIASDDLDGVTSGRLDGLSTVTLGFTYKFKKRGFDKGLSEADVDRAVRASANAYESKIGSLERELANARNAAERSRAELERLRANQGNNVQSSEKHVVSPLAIFFNINSSTVSRKEKVNLKYVAEVIKSSNAKFKVTGYADRQTGTPEYNQALSLRRSKAVYDILVNEFGVSSSQLQVVEREWNEVPFNDMYLDRVAIVMDL